LLTSNCNQDLITSLALVWIQHARSLSPIAAIAIIPTIKQESSNALQIHVRSSRARLFPDFFPSPQCHSLLRPYSFLIVVLDKIVFDW
jgi:hypothetical protein